MIQIFTWNQAWDWTNRKFSREGEKRWTSRCIEIESSSSSKSILDELFLLLLMFELQLRRNYIWLTSVWVLFESMVYSTFHSITESESTIKNCIKLRLRACANNDEQYCSWRAPNGAEYIEDRLKNLTQWYQVQYWPTFSSCFKSNKVQETTIENRLSIKRSQWNLISNKANHNPSKVLVNDTKPFHWELLLRTTTKLLLNICQKVWYQAIFSYFATRGRKAFVLSIASFSLRPFNQLQ